MAQNQKWLNSQNNKLRNEQNKSKGDAVVIKYLYFKFSYVVRFHSWGDGPKAILLIESR